MAKGIAVVSGSSTEKHKFMDTGVSNLGTQGNTSALSGTISVSEDGNNYPDLVSQLATTSGSIVSQKATSITLMDPVGINVEGARVSMAASAYVNIGDNGHDYVALSGKNYIDSAGTLKGADIKLDGGLSSSADDLNVTVLGATGIQGSLTNLIDTLLKGTGVDSTWETLSGLKTAMNNDAALSASIKSAIDLMENTIRGNDASAPEDLVTILAGLTTHRDTVTTGATAREGILGTKLANAKTAMGLEANYSISHTSQNYINNASASLTAVDDALGGALKSRNNRLTATTGSADVGGFTAGARTTSLAIAAAGTAAFSGSVTTSEFGAPEVSTLARMEAIGENGEMVYLNCTDYAAEVAANATLVASYPADKKFYFYEDGVWHPSPFAAE